MKNLPLFGVVLITATLCGMIECGLVREDKHPRLVKLINGNKTKTVMETTTPYPAFLDPEVTVLSSLTLPDASSMPSIGNGYLATVVHSDTMYVDGVYNGKNITSHRARLRSTASISITHFSFNIDNRKYSLDTGRGMYIEEYSQRYVSVELKMYAHQWLNNLLVTEIYVTNDGAAPVHLNLSQTLGPLSKDVHVNTIHENGVRIDFEQAKETEADGDIPAYFLSISSPVPDSITVGPLEASRHLYLTAIAENSLIAMASYGQGLDYFMNGTLESSHVNHWESMWREGRIDVDGDKELSRLNYAALYYLLSEIPQYQTYGPFYGISAGGLGYGDKHNDYKGHVSWDQDTWIFPSLLPLHSDKAKVILGTRVRTHSAANSLAKSMGYEGAMFPWESAYTGLNVCPDSECLRYEHHITGDVAMAFQQFVMMTRDTHFLESEGAADVINDIASFWMSRMTHDNDSDQYEIYDVMGPDKSHVPVNNSAYTNSVAKLSLLLPKYALSLVNKTADPRFEDAAKKTYVPYNNTGKWHPEYDGYVEGTTVQQADTILLGFPLMADLSAETRQNDLEIYEKVTATAPPMTWAMFALGWLELNNTDKAEQHFNKQLENVVGPYKLWSNPEDNKGGLNYLTAIGGYLQSLLYGYGGFRIYPDRLQFSPAIPPNTTSLSLTGIDYLGGSYHFTFSDQYITINQTSAAAGRMKVVIPSTHHTQTLDVGTVIKFRRSTAYLTLS
ncbi:protein-glucosylgalactosylhydroxylysine glucosidase-like [Argopecten irradians]|uniref:protein-glucosylgalactosylhydroxylysine glucosidase-like n=1 Tax=Argopecten irradians TaxID=31199 RepID=UPI00371C9ECD